EPDRRGVVAQTAAHAGRAGDVVDHVLKLVAIEERDLCGFLDGGEQALVLEGEPGLLATLGHVEPGFPCAMQDDAAVARSQVVEGRVGADGGLVGDGLDHALKQGRRSHVGPGYDRAGAEAAPAVRDEFAGIGSFLGAESLTAWTPSEWAVERKAVRRKFVEAS